MSRPRTPTKLLELKGSFKKNPGRARSDEPVVTESLGSVPGELSDAEIMAWNEIVAYSPMGVLTQADTIEVELAARLLAKIRADFENVNITGLRHLHTVLGKFGMNPSDRSKLGVEKEPVYNPFDKF
jgi:hypothetical protein